MSEQVLRIISQLIKCNSYFTHFAYGKFMSIYPLDKNRRFHDQEKENQISVPTKSGRFQVALKHSVSKVLLLLYNRKQDVLHSLMHHKGIRWHRL